jgi:SAM-dependent methyltransferase
MMNDEQGEKKHGRGEHGGHGKQGCEPKGHGGQGPHGRRRDPSMKPLINWDALENMMRGRMPMPPERKGGGKDGEGRPQHGPGQGIGGWDKQAAFYSKMVQMEREYTPLQLDCFDTDPEDTALDVCCGPGRLVVPLAKRVKSVTALDASPKMLELCLDYAREEGVDGKINTLLMDWEDKEAAKEIEPHDIVISSRSLGLFDMRLLSKLARKYVALIIWANGAPSIPQIVGSLFKGTQEEGRGFPHMHQDRRLGNNLFYNKAYDLGYDPNVRILDDGYRRVFSSREEAYAELSTLGMFELPEDKRDIFKNNADEYLTDNADGTVTYFAKTGSMVIWWKV